MNAQQRMDPGPHRKGLLQLNVAVLLGGVTGLFAKLVPLSAISLTCIRSGIAAVGLLLLLTRLTQQLAARAGPLVDHRRGLETALRASRRVRVAVCAPFPGHEARPVS